MKMPEFAYDRLFLAEATPKEALVGLLPLAFRLALLDDPVGGPKLRFYDTCSEHALPAGKLETQDDGVIVTTDEAQVRFRLLTWDDWQRIQLSYQGWPELGQTVNTLSKLHEFYGLPPLD